MKSLNYNELQRCAEAYCDLSVLVLLAPPGEYD